MSESGVSGRFSMTITTDAIAPFVWLSSPLPGIFSDNGFLMRDQRMNVAFQCKDPSASFNKFRSTLSIISLMDLYQL